MIALILAAIAQLSFAQLFEGHGELRPSKAALQLDRRRVRVEGFMARMESPPPGAFWLCRAPLDLDEAGGGTGDLPVESILVVLTPRSSRPVAPMRGPLRVEGRFEVGRKEAEDGTISLFRIVLDAPHSRSKTKRSSLLKEER